MKKIQLFLCWVEHRLYIERFDLWNKSDNQEHFKLSFYWENIMSLGCLTSKCSWETEITEAVGSFGENVWKVCVTQGSFKHEKKKQLSRNFSFDKRLLNILLHFCLSQSEFLLNNCYVIITSRENNKVPIYLSLIWLSMLIISSSGLNELII